MAFIEIKGLTFSYTDDDGNKSTVIDGIDLKVEKGEFLAVLGRNGSGKSTLAKLINMILESDSGSIKIDGVTLSPDMSEEEMMSVRKNVGMVFQNPDNQLVATVVEEDIAFGPENLGLDPEEIRLRVDSALETVGMSEYAKHAPARLSGGQKQRIAIAGILAMMPRCIIFDEATAMLDPAGRDEVMSTICKLNKEFGITVIHITHNMNEVSLADRVVVIDKGRIIKEGTPRQVFSDAKGMFDIGLAVPQVTELCHLLASKGVNIPTDVITEEEALDVLCSLMSDNN